MHALRLAHDAVRVNATASAPDSENCMTELYTLTSRLMKALPNPHLHASESNVMSWIDGVRHRTRRRVCQPLMKCVATIISCWKYYAHVSRDLADAAQDMQWPTLRFDEHIAHRTDAHTVRFEKAFKSLQQYNILHQDSKATTASSTNASQTVDIITALLSRPILRFRYHFESERDTNRLDKPEYYFTHMLNIIQEYLPALLRLNASFGLSISDSETVEQSLSVLSEVLQGHIHRTLSNLRAQPALLAHAIKQAGQFDIALSMLPIGDKFPMKTFAARTFLDKTEIMEEWIAFEKQGLCRSRQTYNSSEHLVVVLDEYDQLVHSKDAWSMDTQEALHKAPQCSQSMRDLLQQVPSMWLNFPHLVLHVTEKIMFFTQIQMSLIELYRAELEQRNLTFGHASTRRHIAADATESFRALSSTFCAARIFASDLEELGQDPVSVFLSQ